ncbi:hypothetical protein TVAG_180460 [Trichomonas vaginalis G3]|uniref:Leucine Rich Repeat family protein n=1 Tax=Trichomonas vaginalis (strain ATCC PRA-98 / G3) TaxID=412133 RepID=A2EE75_TRIV3|nr:L domain-like family [Trichomonas vaginalis G3]EAY09072.1 hypothetical protein TVAG_180460 [Trichomonas vaginalis G3]KAI5503412.1 L domain-like family [Trichomonas vaginalis G3]|eukprot:XP_001321295.1 hypothetical protein [Trichomonas vaginalis G3]
MESKGKNSKAKVTKPLQDCDLDLSMKMISSFEDVVIQRKIKLLDLSWNRLHNFENFSPSSNLETLIVDGNPIFSFRNFPKSSQIKHFSAINTPISILPHFREICLLVIGLQLETINEIEVTDDDRIVISEHELSKRFPKSEITNISQSIADIYRKGEIEQIYSLEDLKSRQEQKYPIPTSLLITKLASIANLKDNEIDYFYQLAFDEQLSLNDMLNIQQSLINEFKSSNVTIVKEVLKNEKSIKQKSRSPKYTDKNPHTADEILNLIKSYVGEEDNSDLDEILDKLREKFTSKEDQ